VAPGIGLGGDFGGDGYLTGEIGLFGRDCAAGDQAGQDFVRSGRHEGFGDFGAGDFCKDVIFAADRAIWRAREADGRVAHQINRKFHESGRRDAFHPFSQEEIDHARFIAGLLGRVDEIGAPGGLVRGQLGLDLPKAGFDHVGREAGAAIEAEASRPDGFDHHAGGGNSAGHFADDIVKPAAMRVGEEAITEPFGIDGRQEDGIRRRGSTLAVFKNGEFRA